MTPEQKQAYDSLMQIIEKAEESVIINGKNVSQANLDRYNRLSTLCAVLFTSGSTKGRIIIEEPSNEKPFVGIRVYLDEFELNTHNKSQFTELIDLADNVIFYGTDENCFDMTFYVNDIWTE